MQIKAINECQHTTNQSIITRVKHHLANKFGKLKTLAKDVFERTPDESKYFVLNGKKIRDKGFLGGPRELPNSVTGPSDLKGIKWGEIEYYPEDIEKMKKMNIDEILLYKKELIEKHQYLGGRFLE